MIEPTMGWLAVSASAFMMLVGPVGILAAYRVYSPEQRSRADLLYHVYLCAWVFVSIVGTATLVLTVTAGVVNPWFPLAQTTILFPLFLIQWCMHKRMEYTGWLERPLAN